MHKIFYKTMGEATVAKELFACTSPERQWIELQRLQAYVGESTSVIGSYLDSNWGDWRNGNPSSDLILMEGDGGPYMIGPVDGSPGVLVIDGERFYSDDWL